MSTVTWFTWEGARVAHAAPGEFPDGISAGAIPAICGKYSPDAWEKDHTLVASPRKKCKRCKERSEAPAHRRMSEELRETSARIVTKLARMTGMEPIELARKIDQEFLVEKEQG